jgi:hypothetical protein
LEVRQRTSENYRKDAKGKESQEERVFQNPLAILENRPLAHSLRWDNVWYAQILRKFQISTIVARASIGLEPKSFDMDNINAIRGDAWDISMFIYLRLEFLEVYRAFRRMAYSIFVRLTA